jgi:hypothetical protein
MTPEMFSDTADFIVVPEGSFGGADALCDMTGVPQLRMVIQNQGQGNVGATTTRVTFSPGGVVEIATPPVPAGQRTTLTPVRIPASCFNPDCDFRVVVDARGNVDEATGEQNNQTDGLCVPP